MQNTHYSCQIFINHEFSRDNFQKFSPNFIKIRPVRAEMFYAYKQTNGHIKTSRFAFAQFCKQVYKTSLCLTHTHTYSVCAKYSMMRFIRKQFVKTC